MTIAMAQLLLEKRKNLETQARELLTRAEGEKRELSAEETVSFNKISTDMDALRAQSDQLVKFQADMTAAGEALREAGHKGQTRERSSEDNLRALAAGEIRSADFYGNPEEMRALTKGTAGAGGNAVGTTFFGKLFESLTETATLLKGGATVLNTTSGENIEIPVVLSNGVAALVPEATAIPVSDPAFAKRSLGAYKYGELIQVSNELLTDTAVDIEGFLSRMAGRAVGNALGADLITGNGVSKPSGIFQTATLGKTGGTGVAGAPTFDDLIDLFYSVTGPYRNSPDAGWLIKDGTAGALRKLKDSSGRYLWEASVTAGTPDLILSKPVYTDPNVAGTGLGNRSVGFGDLSAYYVRLVNGVRFERSDDYAFNTDVVTFRCLIRGDGMLVDQTGAFKYFAGGAS